MIEPAPDKRWRAAAAALWILVALWSAASFAPLLGGYFLSDDFVLLVLFRHWQDEGRLGAALAAKFWGSLDAGENRFYRPLSYASFALNYLASGTWAAPWLAVNVLIHALNGAMVGAIGVLAADGRASARAVAAAAVGAALFLFFAPSAEVVAWISGRFDATATFFTLLSCLLFLRSRRFGDRASWLSLASAVAAFLCKESAAILPFAILLLARLREDALREPAMAARWILALRHASPWIAVAALYLVMRYALFGSFMRVFGGSAPMSAALSGAHWNAVWESLPVWLAAQFRPRYLYPFLVALTALQFALIAFASAPQPRPREALFALASILVLTFVLLAPHVGKLPDDGLGGRLFYQSAAFYGVLVAIALRHARLPYLLWGASLALVLLHAAFQWHALAPWISASAQMRGLVAEVARLDKEMQPGEYALVLTPALLDDIPFARYAQGGLMLPPLFDPPVSARLLVQNYDEIPQLPAKIAAGVVTTLRQILVWDYDAGKRVAAAPPEYPTRVVCWDPVRRRLVPLPVDAGPTPQAWAQSIQLALVSSACASRTGGR